MTKAHIKGLQLISGHQWRWVVYFTDDQGGVHVSHYLWSSFKTALGMVLAWRRHEYDEAQKPLANSSQNVQPYVIPDATDQPSV